METHDDYRPWMTLTLTLTLQPFTPTIGIDTAWLGTLFTPSDTSQSGSLENWGPHT